MTDIDLAAIRERYTVWKRISDAGNDDLGEGTVAMVLAGNDVPALLAAVERLTAERDQVACERDGVREELARMAGDLDDARSERDRLRGDWEVARTAHSRKDAMYESACRDMGAIAAERDAMRPVVEAAVAWRNQPVDTWQPADEYERDIIAAVDAYAAGRDEVPPTPTTDAEIERLTTQATAWMVEARHQAAERDRLAATVERVRALRDDWYRRPGHTENADALDEILDALSAPQAPGVDSGTSEARTAGSGDAGPADGVVAAESDPLAEAIAAYFGGFVQEEGATYRHNDFAEGLIESLTDAGWNLDAIGHPNTWALPAEPGPEVTAVRAKAGRIYRRVYDGWRGDGLAQLVDWHELLRYAPLTNATGETP